MLSGIRSRLTFANVMSVLAFFIAVSTGGAYAANTVFSEDIVDGQVKTVDLGADSVTQKKIAPNAVTSPRVYDNNLTGQDIRGDSLTGSDIDESTLSSGLSSTPTGPAGGDLKGTYPNPLIAADAVGGSEVAPESLGGSDVFNDTLTGSDIVESMLQEVPKRSGRA